MIYQNDITSDVSNYTPEQKEILQYALNRNWGVPVFKLDHFVGDAQYTPFGKVRQFLLELKSREELITDLEHEIQKCRFEIELELELQESTDSPAQKKIHDLNIREKQRIINNRKVAVSMVYEERDKIMALIDRFNNSEDGKLPDGRRVIDVFGDHEEEERLEADLWRVRLGAQAAHDILFYGRVNAGNMEAIYQLPEDVRHKALEYAVERSTNTAVELKQLQSMVDEKLGISQGESVWREIEFK